MKQMRYLFFILLLRFNSVFAVESQDADCGRFNAYEGKVFSFEIASNFDVTFKLCKSKKQDTLFVSATNLRFFDKDVKTPATIRKHIKLSKEDYQTIFQLYEIALKYNTLDAGMGNDGSSWCLESQRAFTYTKACFWSADYRTEERGLEGLYNLGIYLLNFSGLEKGISRL